jgi:hypothetical protein
MATRNNVINILTPQEKNLFLQIKEKFNKAEDRTIYVRLLYIILANSKSKTKINLEKLFNDILKANDNTVQIYELLKTPLFKFMPSMNSNLPQQKYTVHRNQIYAMPANSLPFNASNVVYTRPRDRFRNNPMMVNQPHVYQTINGHQPRNRNINHENNYEDPEKLLADFIAPTLPPRLRHPVTEIDLNKVVATPGVREINLNNVILEAEKKIGIPNARFSSVGGSKRKITRRIKQTKKLKQTKKI